MLELAIIILSATVNLIIGAFVYAKNSSSATNRLFAVLSFCLVTLPSVNYFSLHSTDHILLYIRLVILIVVVLNLIFWWLALVFPGHRFKFSWARRAELIYSIALAVLVLSPFVFSGLQISDSGNISPTPAFGLFFFGISLIYSAVGGTVLLIRRYRRSKGLEKAQLRYILMGLTGLYGFSIVTNFLVVVLLHFSGLVILTPLYTVIFALCMSAAIIKHRLFDIRLIVARSIAYALLLATLAGGYAAAIFGATAILFSGQSVSLLQNWTYIGLAIVLAFTFQPLRRFFERITDRVLFRDNYDSAEVLSRIGKILASELLLRRILEKSLAEVCQQLRVEVGQFVVLEGGKIYQASHFGPSPDKIVSVSELTKLLPAPLLIVDELPDGDRKDILDKHGLRLSVLLRTKDEIAGVLLLGDKLSGDIYSRKDLRLLDILSSELAVAIVNAKAYEEISQFNATLQQKINEATLDLRTANTNLKSLDRAKDEFISIASHQLRTPLTSIKGYLSMLREGNVDRLSIEQRQFIDFAYAGAERMVSLISDLLNVSRLSAGRFILERQPVDLAKIALEETKQLAAHAQGKGIELLFEHPSGHMPIIELDESKTRQVIMNFIDNAVYYTPKGKITVNIETDDRKIRLLVKDTGIGVPIEVQGKLFTKFYRAPNAQAVRPDGTGLGLYLAKQVIEEQGGKMVFETVEGKGSTFGFEFPIPTPIAGAPTPVGHTTT